MSAPVPSQGLFRLYAVLWLVGAAAAVTLAFQLAVLPHVVGVGYLAVGVALWAVDMVLTSGSPRQGHGLAHAVLVAAAALAWPVVLLVLAGYLGRGVMQEIRR